MSAHTEVKTATPIPASILVPTLLPAVGLVGALAIGSLMAMPLAASASPKVWMVTSVASVPEARQPAHPTRASRSLARTPIVRKRPTPVQMRSVVEDVAVGAVESGQASWYGGNWAGRTTASGEIFRPSEFTAAHKYLPFGTRARVCTQWTCVVVRITDRGPYVAGRIIDLSEGAAAAVGLLSSGVGYVTLTPIETRSILVPVVAAPVARPIQPVKPQSSRGEEPMPHGPGSPVARTDVSLASSPTSAPSAPSAPSLALAPISLLGTIAGVRGRYRLGPAELPQPELRVA